MTVKYTMADVRASNRAKGYHWFDRRAMNFFNCKIETGLYKSHCFVTSEDYWPEKGGDTRQYTVRYWNKPTGQVMTIGDSSSIPSLEVARRIARQHIR